MTEEKLQQAEFLQNEIKKLKSLISHLDGDYIQHTNVKLNQPDEILFNYWNGNYQMRVPSEYVKIELPDRREIQKKLAQLEKQFAAA